MQPTVTIPQAADVSALYGLQPLSPQQRSRWQPATKGAMGFGIVLDGDNVVTRLKEESGGGEQIAVGDRVLAVNGIAVSRDYPVKSVAIDLPDGAAATLPRARRVSPAPVPFATRAGDDAAADARRLLDAHGGLPPVAPAVAPPPALPAGESEDDILARRLGR